MSDFNIQFEEQDQSVTLEFEQIGGGAVKSVNGKTGVVVLDAEDVGAYTKPTGGIPKTDLASAVQTSLGKADSAYQKPSGGIPAGDIASGVVPAVDNTLTVSGAAADAKKTGDEIATVKDGLTAVETQLEQTTADALAAYVTDTASGAIASFPDGAAMPVKSLTVDIEPVQSGSGDPSPTNIRPISGHTSATVTRCGANLIDDTLSGHSNEVLLNVGTWYAKAFLAPSAVSSGSAINTRLQFNKNGAWTNIVDASTDLDGYMTVSGTYFGWIYTNQVMTINVLKPVMVRFDLSAMNGTRRLLISNTNPDAFVEFTDCDTYTIDLDGTRYGGTLNVETGVLTVDRAIVDMGTLTYTYDSASKRFGTQSNAIPIKPISGATVLSNMICSQYKTVKGQDQYDDITLDASISQGGGSSAIVRIRDTAYTDATAFKTAMNGVQLCYELATPFEVQLTAEDDITTLKGQNNIWADCGDVEVEYRADTKLYIQKVLNT